MKQAHPTDGLTAGWRVQKKVGARDGSEVKSARGSSRGPKVRSVPSSQVKWLTTTSNSSSRGITGFKPPGHPHSWAQIHTKINLRKKAME